MNTEALLQAIDAAAESAYGDDQSSEINAKRAEAIEAYLGLNVNPSPEGRSQVVDRSVFETIHTILPSLTRIFAGSSEEVCKFLPVGPEDEAAAEQTTAVVNHIATQLNQWEQIVTDWVHDALLSPNSYCLAWWDESERRVRETYEGQSDDQLAALVQDQGVEVIQHSQYIDEQMTADAQQAYQQAVQQAMAQGMDPSMIPPPQPVMLHDVVIERNENEGKVCLRVLPPEHCKVSSDTPDWSLRDCPYFEYREQKTIADLRAMGLEVDDDISDDEEDDTEEDIARNRFLEDEYLGDDGKGPLRRVWTRMIWVKADGDNSGVVQTWYVLAVGRTILHAEPVSRIFVSAMTAQPLPHRHPGMSVAETVMDIQAIKTAVKRGGLDNLYLANNARWAVSSRVNLDDMLNVRPGGIVRMLDDSLPSEGHIMPMATPLAFDSIIGSLEYFDQERQNRSGAMRGAAGLEANAMNRAAVGTTMAMQSHSAMRTEHVARMMAPAVEYLFELVHELISKHRNKPLTIKLRGQWTQVDPQAWRTKRDCRISVGVGAGNKEAMQMHLAQMFGAQMQLLPLGIAGPQQIHATVTEMAKLAGFANPAKFWLDPTNMPPQEPQIPPEVQREQMKIQAEAQKVQFEAQQNQLKMQAETELEREKMRMQVTIDQQREEMQARQKMLEAQTKAELEAQKAQIQAQQEMARLEFERWKAELDAAVKLQIAQMGNQPPPDVRIDEALLGIRTIMEELQSPAEIVRGPDGRAMAVKRGGTIRQVVRDPQTGRPVGLQ